MTEMRKVTFVVVGLVVLGTAGLAVAKAVETKSIKSVTGTFAATTVQQVGKAKTCTTADGKTLVTTNARYSGVAAGDGNLAGSIRLDARSVINTTDNIGVVDGKLRIHVAFGGGETVARFTGVLVNGKLVGFATGHTPKPHAKLYANLSSSFSATTGFAGGKIGSADGGSAVEVGSGKCAPKHDSASKGEKKGHDKKKGDDN